MPSHNWTTPESAVCRRCGARRDWHTGITGERFRYSLPDGLGSLDARPACGKGSESRRTRKMGRRAKVLARHRAGGPRLLSKEAALAKVGAVVRGLAGLAVPVPGPTSSPSGEPDAS
jgi:hypothetical protein